MNKTEASRVDGMSRLGNWRIRQSHTGSLNGKGTRPTAANHLAHPKVTTRWKLKAESWKRSTSIASLLFLFFLQRVPFVVLKYFCGWFLTHVKVKTFMAFLRSCSLDWYGVFLLCCALSKQNNSPSFWSHVYCWCTVSTQQHAFRLPLVEC